MRDMGERAQRKLRLKFASFFLDERAPHESSCGVVREWEVKSFVEEFLKLFLATGVRFTCAPDNSYTGVIINELSLPFCQGLFDSRRSGRVLLLFALLALLFCGPDFFCLVDVDD